MSNKSLFKTISGSICAPRGFQAAAVFCDIKQLGTGKGSEKGKKPDLALIVSDTPATVAGTFTTNRVSAAPVKLSAKVAARDTARAIVVNSGNANACTGKQGMRDARAMARMTAATVAATCRHPADEHGLEAHATMHRRYKRIQPNEVLVCSTGRIGVPLPMLKVERGIRACGSLLARSDRNAREAAEAIMTSDTRRKEVAVELKIAGKPVRVGGICKGAGMIQPRMKPSALRSQRHATMLAFVTSDVAISSHLLKRALADAAEQSFNRITVDGDMSTNDSVIALANGLAGNARIQKVDRTFRAFEAALSFVCLELAKMIVRDGEGVSRFVTIRVHNARNTGEAEAVARSVANSTLVRTSWCGGDPNWGRILCAIGYSGAAIKESQVGIGYSAPGQSAVLRAFRRGAPVDSSFAKLVKITAAPEFDVHIDLGRGRDKFVLYASDLTEEYVNFNKGDVTDPQSLGG